MAQIGWCAGIDSAELLRDNGYDFIECTLVGLNLEDRGESRKRIAAYKNSPLPVRAVNVFFPGNLKITGPDVDLGRVHRYVNLAAEALGEIGVKLAVLGSGGARSIPEGWERERAQDQLLQLFGYIGERFDGIGTKLGIEPLNARESNIVNSVAEAAWYTERLGSGNVGITADLYHMQTDAEPLETLIDNARWICHVHIADTGRLAPGTGSYPYDSLADRLERIGYDGAISVECSSPLTAETASSSLAYIKRVL